MARWICTACGTQFPDVEAPPPVCAICDDDREPPNRQAVPWTTLPDLVATDRRLRVVAHEPGLTGIGTDPAFAIGQRPILARTPAGNILWDCMAWLDGEVERVVRDRGGLAAIAISHPHYYTGMADWAHRFDCPVFLHTDDREWITRPDDAIELWEGETHDLGHGLTLIRCGGHFAGGTVLHDAERRALLSGDIVQVIPDRGWVSFMYSYPNLIPLPAAEVERMAAALEPYAFDSIQGAWWETTIPHDAKAIVRRSADRYIRALAGEMP